MLFSLSARRILLVSLGLATLLAAVSFGLKIRRQRAAAARKLVETVVWKRTDAGLHYLVYDATRKALLGSTSNHYIWLAPSSGRTILTSTWGAISRTLTSDGDFDISIEMSEQPVTRQLPFAEPPLAGQQSQAPKIRRPRPRTISVLGFDPRAILARDPQTGTLLRRIPLENDGNGSQPVRADVMGTVPGRILISESEVTPSKDLHVYFDTYDLQDYRRIGRFQRKRFNGSTYPDSFILTSTGEFFMDNRPGSDSDGSLHLNTNRGNIFGHYMCKRGLVDGTLESNRHYHPVALSPRKQYIAAIFREGYSDSYIEDGKDGTLMVWDRANTKLLWSLQEELTAAEKIWFSPDEKMLAVSLRRFKTDGFATRGILRLYDARTGKIVVEFAEEDSANASLFGLNWRRKPGQSHGLDSRPGDSSPVESLVWLPDGKSIGVSYDNGDIKMWRIPEQA